MRTINQEFSITYQYPVIFTYHVFQKDNDAFCDFLNRSIIAGEEKKALFVLDEGMLQHHPQLTEEIEIYLQLKTSIKLAPFSIVPGGEEVKNTSRYLKEILSAINNDGIDRHSFVVAVGGGAVLDLAGYAAATAHRGIRHIRIPTTVLSQNDSGMGVKNGINNFEKKNFLGTFTPPSAVFNDSHFLSTLDNRNWRSGMTEAVKVALIKDAEFFKWIEDNAIQLSNRDMEAMEYLVFRCAELHLQHISSGDPFEKGSSRPLDFGHWSAHKLEQLSNFSLSHGEAVAIGIALDTVYSEQIGWLTPEERERVLLVLQKLGFELYHPLLEEELLLDGLAEFREHLGGRLTIMMLRKIGKGENVHVIDTDLVKKSIHILKYYKELLTD
jgi:3-dehydroquinate synthase